MEERLGELWPLALALAVAGVIVGLAGGRRVEQMLAVVAAASALAYVLTPLSAAGPEGMPLAFRLNIRYLAPALALGLRAARGPAEAARRRCPAAVDLGRTGALLGPDPGQQRRHRCDRLDRLPGEAILALAVIALPVGVVLLARRGMPRAALAAAAAALIGLALIGRAAQDTYLETAIRPPRPTTGAGEHPSIELGHGLGAAYDWARATSGLRIGLSGTEGALFQYGLWGADSSNEVRFIGDRGDRGSFDAIGECPEFVAAVNTGDYDYLVTTPGYDQDDPEAATVPIERSLAHRRTRGARARRRSRARGRLGARAARSIPSACARVPST